MNDLWIKNRDAWIKAKEGLSLPPEYAHLPYVEYKHQSNGNFGKLADIDKLVILPGGSILLCTKEGNKGRWHYVLKMPEPEYLKVIFSFTNPSPEQIIIEERMRRKKGLQE